MGFMCSSLEIAGRAGLQPRQNRGSRDRGMIGMTLRGGAEAPPFQTRGNEPWLGYRGRSFRFSVSGFRRALPSDLRREVLGDQLLVIGPKFPETRSLLALRVQIVRLELAHPLEHGPVALAHQVFILALLMGGVEGVVANDVTGLLRQVIPHHAIHILIVA